MSDPVQDQYDAYPYPARDPADERTRLITGSPSNLDEINHYVFAGSNIKIDCDGVPVAAGDIIAADNDGVVVVPRDKAEEVLKKAQQMDFTEHSMYPFIFKYKSVEEAIKKFGRI